MKISIKYPLPILLLLLQCACKQPQETPPIPDATMAKLLADVHLAEIYSQGLGKDSKNRVEKNRDSLSGFYISILKHYDVSYEDFEDALEWYKERPSEIDSLYGKVITQLAKNKIAAKVKDKEEPENNAPAKPDSLTNKTMADSLKAQALADSLNLKKPNRKDSTTGKKTNNLPANKQSLEQSIKGIVPKSNKPASLKPRTEKEP
ncbi:MAG: DUF4296 domain-containing protein [Edaphocola sp.]